MKYIAIIGDIKESKNIVNRGQIQRQLHYALQQINEKYEEDIAAKFIITLGDEFQGLMKNTMHVLDMITYIQQVMYPVKIRFGIGFGEISTDIFCEAAIGADGPAYYAARKSIEELREQEKKLKSQAADVQLSLYETSKFEVEEINTFFTLIKVIEDSWSEKQRFTIWDVEQNGGSQKECAERMNTTQSTIARRLADGKYLTYVRAKQTIDEALRRLGK